MPKGYKDPSTLVAEITMSSASHAGSFLLLEGEDDLRFWLTRHHAQCEPLDAEGKSNVICSIRRLDLQRFDRALGIVDSDYDMLMDVPYGSTNIVATDAHDLECLLCRSAALDGVMAELGDVAKIRRFETKEGADVRRCLLDRALVFGRLRWAARRHDDTEGLRDISIPRFVDENTWDVNGDGLLSTVASRSSNNASVWAQRVADLPAADPWHVARGHDMIDILRIGLRKVLGSVGPQVGRKEITRILRQAMPRDEFEATGLHADIRRWETQNAPYAVLSTAMGGQA